LHSWKRKEGVHSEFLRLAVAHYQPVASAALGGSLFGSVCQIAACKGQPSQDFFQEEFTVLLFSCCSLVHESISTIATTPQLSALLADSARIMETAASLMNRFKEPVDANIKDSEGWWDGLVDFEHSAQERLKEALSSFGTAFSLLAEAGCPGSHTPPR